MPTTTNTYVTASVCFIFTRGPQNNRQYLCGCFRMFYLLLWFPPLLLYIYIWGATVAEWLEHNSLNTRLLTFELNLASAVSNCVGNVVGLLAERRWSLPVYICNRGLSSTNKTWTPSYDLKIVKCDVNKQKKYLLQLNQIK